MTVGCVHLDLSPIDENSREVAERELGETPEKLAESIAELRRLLSEQSDLYFDDNEVFLLMLLRPCHFHPESAIKLVSEILI